MRRDGRPSLETTTCFDIPGGASSPPPRIPTPPHPLPEIILLNEQGRREALLQEIDSLIHIGVVQQVDPNTPGFNYSSASLGKGSEYKRVGPPFRNQTKTLLQGGLLTLRLPQLGGLMDPIGTIEAEAHTEISEVPRSNGQTNSATISRSDAACQTTYPLEGFSLHDFRYPYQEVSSGVSAP